MSRTDGSGSPTTLLTGLTRTAQLMMLYSCASADEVQANVGLAGWQDRAPT